MFTEPAGVVIMTDLFNPLWPDEFLIHPRNDDDGSLNHTHTTSVYFSIKLAYKNKSSYNFSFGYNIPWPNSLSLTLLMLAKDFKWNLLPEASLVVSSKFSESACKPARVWLTGIYYA